MTFLTMFWDWSLNAFDNIKKLEQLPPGTEILIEGIIQKLRLKQLLYLKGCCLI